MMPVLFQVLLRKRSWRWAERRVDNAKLASILSAAKKSIKAITDIVDLAQLRVDLLGKKGQLTQLLKGVSQLPAKDRPHFGKSVNLAKQEIRTFF